MREGDFGVFGPDAQVMKELKEAKPQDAAVSPEQRLELEKKVGQIIKKARLIMVRKNQCRVALESTLGEAAGTFLDRVDIATIKEMASEPRSTAQLQEIYTDLGWNIDQLEVLRRVDAESYEDPASKIVISTSQEWLHVEDYAQDTPGGHQRHTFGYWQVAEGYGLLVNHTATEIIDGAPNTKPFLREAHYATQKEIEQLLALVDAWYGRITTRYTLLEQQVNRPETDEGGL